MQDSVAGVLVKKKLCARFLVVKEPCARNSPFGSWLQFWPKCPTPLWKRWKSDYLAKLRRGMCWLAARSQNEWISNWVFSPENCRSGSRSICRRSACSDSQGNYTFVALAPQISIRFRKFTSLSDGNKSSHHCQIKKGSHWFVETDSHLSRKHENYCNPWNYKRDTVSKSGNILNTPQPKSHNERSVLIAHIPY